MTGSSQQHVGQQVDIWYRVLSLARLWQTAHLTRCPYYVDMSESFKLLLDELKKVSAVFCPPMTGSSAEDVCDSSDQR